MKKMRTVVSTLLLVCLLASMLAVSASADGTVSIRFASDSGAQAGGTYEKAADSGINVRAVVTVSGTYNGSVKAFWKVDGEPYGEAVDLPEGDRDVTAYFPCSSFTEGTSHTIELFVEENNNELTGYGKTLARSGSFTLVVKSAVPALTGVVFNKDSVQLKRYAEEYPVFAKKVPETANGTIEYSVQDAEGNPSGVASYDVTRQAVVASGEGTAYLVATVKDDSGNVLLSNKIPIYVTVPVTSITINTPYLDDSNYSEGINYTVVSESATWPKLQWTSSNPKVATVKSDDGSGTVQLELGGAAGTTTITATSTDGTAVSGKCLVTISSDDKTLVTVTPAKADLVVGESITLTAYVSGKDSESDTAYFDHWYCTSSAVNITRDGNVATITAKSATSNPIEVRAYSNDGKYGYALINISKSEALELSASATTVKSGKTVTISVDNARNNETFTWSYSPSDAGFVSNAYEKGNNFCIVGGDLEGSITVTCTSDNDSSRTASVLLGINSVDPYGNAYIMPKSVNWTRGSGDLTFQISPAAYWTYLDNQYLNTKSTSLASYWNGTLTLKSAYLNTLSNGTHTLKVYTAYDEYNNPTGLVYANIYISGNGTSASATYGDNAHVKGTASNLYFNSGNAISDVYISGKWIDPANYSLSTDGKTLTLNSSFLNQLSYGTYTMNLNGTNGSTQSTTFRIVTANYAPSTGDETNIGLWVAIMILSGAGAIALIPRRKNMMQ